MRSSHLMVNLHVSQYDVHGNLFGLLAAHPVTPLISLHHLDVVEPIFPNVTRVQALQHLQLPMKLDSAALMQQSICYDKTRSWTISVSWGYAVQIFRGIFSVREMEMPARTFLNWYKRADYTAYSFNTRPFGRNACQKPFVYHMSDAVYEQKRNQTWSQYVLQQGQNAECSWKMADPSRIQRVEVYKRPDPHLWEKVCEFFSLSFESATSLNVNRFLVCVFLAASAKELLQSVASKEERCFGNRRWSVRGR